MRPTRFTPLVGLGIFVAVSSAHADDAADTATARALGIEGVTLADAGRCRDAVEKLERADRLHHAPTTATRLAECEIELGRIVAGTERLQRIVREPLPANAHPAFGAAVARAQKALDAALPRVATLRITVPTAGARPTVTVDGEVLPEAALDAPRRIDPGTHTIHVQAPGFRPGVVSSALQPGEARTVSVELVVDPDARTADAAAPNAAATTTSPAAGRSKIPALLAFGAGAVGLGLGIAGAVAVDRSTRTLDQRCDANRVCPTDVGSDLKRARTWATVSTAGFVVAGAGAVSGLVLLVLARTPEDRAPATARIRPTVGLGSVGVNGTF